MGVVGGQECHRRSNLLHCALPAGYPPSRSWQAVSHVGEGSPVSLTRPQGGGKVTDVLARTVAAGDAETKRTFQKSSISIPWKLLAGSSPTVHCGHSVTSALCVLCTMDVHCGPRDGSHLPPTRSEAGGFLTSKRTVPEALSQIWK